MFLCSFNKQTAGHCVIFLLLTSMSSCGKNDNTPATSLSQAEPAISPITTGNWYKPALGSSWQWQLTGTINTNYNVNIYDIDLFDSSEQLIQTLQAQGKRVICYFSAGSYESWRSDKSQFLINELGNSLANWQGERWLDIRSPNVQAIMASRLDLAVQKGCDGVEPDNVDGYMNNSGFNLTANDQLVFTRFIANQAHTRGLAVGLKNNLHQVNELHNYFDFAVNEQCYEYQECELLTPFINSNKAVFHVEYNSKYSKSSTELNNMCDDAINRQFSSLVLPINLDDEFRISCL
ncbi:endo alpha-1,4 polygalactosaminidase [Pseudoalteromonas sp. MIP2626]|uniref:endo alpha-1,4 polygalactosaminidase n=1 Tax=Pseudoalteromonas sp. MIP2626 TaxID=2705464 RepID=UPI0015CC532B|nr:endo alpha-1,4 polygalactosaminidase [Pseudoalteromonas sp. MIP2626]NYR13208.1 endo alpha-1,4 polygalactosaminidase [Pseudoalteromonas sp. MIP2626]